MNNLIRQRWLTRLRSNQDGQCRKFLHPRPGVFDVLGLLVDLYVEDGLGSWHIVSPARRVFSLGGVESVLPPAVRRWSGLTMDEANRLVALNDTGHSFAQLATWIEMNIPGENHEPTITAGISPAMGTPAMPGPAGR